MKRRIKNLFSGGVMLVISLLIFAAGCKKEESPTETSVPKLCIMGRIEGYQYASYPDSFRYRERVEVSNAEVVPLVKINDQELELHPYILGFDFAGDFSLTPDTACELVVTAGSDTATATVTLPGDFSIIAPDTSYVLTIGTSLDASWDSASHSDYYRVFLYVEYQYYDTSGTVPYFNFSSDTILSETSITYESSLLWPSEIDSIYHGGPSPYGYFSVHAISGPSPVPDTPGNISGDGTGFFWAEQWRECVFDVGTAKKTSKEDRARQCKEALKEQDKLWKQRIESLKEELINN